MFQLSGFSSRVLHFSPFSTSITRMTPPTLP
jgi:hypothetical protein